MIDTYAYKSLQTKEMLEKFLYETNKDGFLSEISFKLKNLVPKFDNRSGFENVPQELYFEITFNYMRFDFSVFINIDKVYRFFENVTSIPIKIPIDILDLNLALKADGNTRFPERPILILSDMYLSNLFTENGYKGKYYPIDGRNRIKLKILNGHDTILCYPVSTELLLECMMSEYDALAIEALISYCKEVPFI